jgi:hypothetical protein
MTKEQEYNMLLCEDGPCSFGRQNKCECCFTTIDGVSNYSPRLDIPPKPRSQIDPVLDPEWVAAYNRSLDRIESMEARRAEAKMRREERIKASKGTKVEIIFKDSTVKDTFIVEAELKESPSFGFIAEKFLSVLHGDFLPTFSEDKLTFELINKPNPLISSKFVEAICEDRFSWIHIDFSQKEIKITSSKGNLQVTKEEIIEATGMFEALNMSGLSADLIFTSTMLNLKMNLTNTVKLPNGTNKNIFSPGQWEVFIKIEVK